MTLLVGHCTYFLPECRTLMLLLQANALNRFFYRNFSELDS